MYFYLIHFYLINSTVFCIFVGFQIVCKNLKKKNEFFILSYIDCQPIPDATTIEIIFETLSSALSVEYIFTDITDSASLRYSLRHRGICLVCSPLPTSAHLKTVSSLTT